MYKMALKYRRIFYVAFLALMMVVTACGQSAAKVTPVNPPITMENATATTTVNTAAPVAKAESQQPVRPANQQKIVFWSKPDNFDIFIADADGKNQVNLTNSPGDDLVPRLSPDGRKILFTSNRKWDPDNKFDEGWNIFVMDTDGSNVRNLTGSETSATMPCWSPDGTMIAFCDNHKSQYMHIWITDVEGKYFLQITPDRTAGAVNIAPRWPSWSPDGTKILYTYPDSGTYDLWVMDIDYNMLKQLKDMAANYPVSAKWSATGDRKNFGDDFSTALVKGVRKLSLNPTGFDGGASWSPDGSKIAYMCSHKDNGVEIPDIYVMNSDGSNPVNLTNATAEIGAFNDWPVWSPDGKSIAFVTKSDGKRQIYKMSADGKDMIRMIGNDYEVGSPNWGIVPTEVADKIK